VTADDQRVLRGQLARAGLDADQAIPVLEEAGRPGQEHQWWSVVAGAPAPPTL